MCNIVPGILEKDWESIEAKINQVKDFSKVIHIDIIDGKFAENQTFLDPKPFTKYTKDYLFELHMMVDEPVNFIRPFSDAGFKRFLGHVEKMSDQEEFVAQGQLAGEVGLALDGPTSIDAIKVNLSDLDAILIMTIKAGFSGQKFVGEYLTKIEQLKNRFIEENVFKPPVIEVDGGINEETLAFAKDKGIQRFVSTSYIFKDNPAEQYRKLKLLSSRG
jgi:ribulose-phosphate 3-epimerase